MPMKLMARLKLRWYMQQLRCSDWATTRSDEEAMARLVELKASDAVAELLSHEKPAVRRNAAEILAKIKHKDSVSALTDAFSNAQNAYEGERPNESHSDGSRRGARNSKRADVKVAIMKALIAIAPGEALDTLAHAVRDTNYQVRKTAVRLLLDMAGMLLGGEKRINLSDERLISAFRTATKDSDWEISSDAARGLGEVGGNPEARILATLMEDDNKFVADCAMGALRSILARHPDEELKRLLMDAKGKADEEKQRRKEDSDGAARERERRLQAMEGDLTALDYSGLVRKLREIVLQMNPGRKYGRTCGFLWEDYGPVAKEVGKRLHQLGGKAMMLNAHKSIAQMFRGTSAARELELSWDGIGDWLG